MTDLQHDGAGGWINIEPRLPVDVLDQVPRRSGLGAWFSGRGPQLPMATWIPSSESNRRSSPAQVGIEHGTGPNALARLEEGGHPLPKTWTRRQDHAKHGIVAELPSEASPGDVVEWLVEATSMLSDVVALGDRWQAVVHRPI